MSGGLLSVADARARVMAAADGRAIQTQAVALGDARGRTLSENIHARRTQPPMAVSAMDGYAVRAADLASVPARLRLIGQSAAGHGFAGAIAPGETVRIFTGAPVPTGADAILIQENANADGDMIEARDSVLAGRNVRAAGLDFAEGDVLLAAGRRVGPAEIALAAAMNHAALPVARKPRVAILATGDELVRPGEPIGPDQIVASNSYAIAAYVEGAGGEPFDLGIATDDFASLEAAIRKARDLEADILVTLGGASVGDHDLVQNALAQEGMELGFWRIAMRPGKPLIHGRLGAMAILGLPGNPVSSIVCGILFLLPLIRLMSGDETARDEQTEAAVLGIDLKANDVRQDYLRATLAARDDGLPVVTPFSAQDSSLLGILAKAQCLVVRAPHAPAAKAGDLCRIVRLPQQ